MSDDDTELDTISLSRRKLLGSAALVGGVGAMGAGGTSALFWEEEKFGTADNPNFLQAGALDLKVDWNVRYYDWMDDTDPAADDQGDRGSINATSADEETAENGLVDQPGPLVQLTDLKPGDVIEKTLSVHLFDNPGFVSMSGDITVDSDNGITEPEDKVNGHEADGSDGDPFVNSALGLGALGLLGGAKSGTSDGEVTENRKSKSMLRRVARAAGLGVAGAAGLSAFTGSSTALPSSATVTPRSGSGITATQLAESLIGEDSSVELVSGTAQYTGSDISVGTFSGGLDPVGIDEGIILSSGAVENIIGPNSSDGISEQIGTPGDSDLSNLAGQETNDAAILEFDFTVPEGEDTVYFNYVFGSEEYNEWIDQFNDVFAFFVNGDNAAVVNGDAVSVDTVNPDDHADRYNNNDPSDTGVPFDTEMDGFTDVLQIEAPVNPGEQNTMKLAIADGGDSALDSWVLIESETLGTEDPSEEPTGDGELDNLMECVVWYDGNDAGQETGGDNFPAEILPEDHGYEPGGQEFVMDLTEGEISFVDNENLLFRGSFREMFDTLQDGQLLNPGEHTPDEFGESMCFDNSTTHYIGVLCWLPRDIPGYVDNIIQTDRLEYYFGFDAIQCRHNVTDDGTPINGTIAGADAENNALVDGGD